MFFIYENSWYSELFLRISLILVSNGKYCCHTKNIEHNGILTLLDETEIIRQYLCKIRKIFKRKLIPLNDE